MQILKRTDLEKIRIEEEKEKTAASSTVKSIAELYIENKKKDVLIAQLSQTIAKLNIEIVKLKGGV